MADTDKKENTDTTDSYYSDDADLKDDEFDLSFLDDETTADKEDEKDEEESK